VLQRDLEDLHVQPALHGSQSLGMIEQLACRHLLDRNHIHMTTLA